MTVNILPLPYGGEALAYVQAESLKATANLPKVGFLNSPSPTKGVHMKSLITISFMIFLLSACMPSGAAREEYVRQHPDLDTDTKVDIIMGRIRRGMSKEHVKVIMGEPCGYCYGTKTSSWGDTWEYNTFGTGRYSAGSGFYVFFDNQGKVTGWSK